MPRTALPIAPRHRPRRAPATASALDEQGYWAFADRMQARIDRTGTTRRPLLRLQRRRARRRPADARRSPPAAATGPARNDRRARRLVDALVFLAAVRREAPAALDGPAAHAPGFVSSMDTAAGPTSTSSSTRRSSTGSARVARPPRARPLRRAGGRDRRPHPPHRDGQLLALAGDPPQPDQLVRARLRGQRDRDQQPAAAPPRPAAADRALRRAGARVAGTAGNLGPGLRFNYLPHMRPARR